LVADRWNHLSLAVQYGIAGSVVVICAMLAIGLWVTRVIEDGLKQNAGAATALYVDSIIAPILPELRGSNALDQGVVRALDETLSAGALGDRLKSFKIWRADGSILYALDGTLIGRKFPVSDALARAFDGHVVAELDELADEESARERATGLPLLEIYSPIREPWSGNVVAVLEFYEVASDIEARLATARLESWLVVGAVAAATVGLLFGIVSRGSRTIDRQQRSLTARVKELSRLSAQNTSLRERIQSASSRTAALNEHHLRRIGSDLHDGPAQLVAFAALRLESKAMTDAATPQPDRDKEVAAIRTSLDEAMREIRSICSGLVLPEIESAGVNEVIELAIAAHERRTGGAVKRPRRSSANLSVPQKIVVFRFIQEALNNGYRHAGGKGQAVEAGTANGRLDVVVSDRGGGFDPKAARGNGLGLAGLKERVESIGGRFELETGTTGTRVSMTLDVEELEHS
jgi:signal transduction histidine kinase